MPPKNMISRHQERPIAALMAFFCCSDGIEVVQQRLVWAAFS